MGDHNPINGRLTSSGNPHKKQPSTKGNGTDKRNQSDGKEQRKAEKAEIPVGSAESSSSSTVAGGGGQKKAKWTQNKQRLSKNSTYPGAPGDGGGAPGAPGGGGGAPGGGQNHSRHGNCRKGPHSYQQHVSHQYQGQVYGHHLQHSQQQKQHSHFLPNHTLSDFHTRGHAMHSHGQYQHQHQHQGQKYYVQHQGSMGGGHQKSQKNRTEKEASSKHSIWAESNGGYEIPYWHPYYKGSYYGQMPIRLLGPPSGSDPFVLIPTPADDAMSAERNRNLMRIYSELEFEPEDTLKAIYSISDTILTEHAQKMVVARQAEQQKATDLWLQSRSQAEQEIYLRVHPAAAKPPT